MAKDSEMYDFMVREVISRGGASFEVIDRVTGETLMHQFRQVNMDPFYPIAATFLIAHIFVFVMSRLGVLTFDLIFFVEIAILCILALLYRMLRRDMVFFETNRRRSIFEVMRFLRPRNEREKEQLSADWVD